MLDTLGYRRFYMPILRKNVTTLFFKYEEMGQEVTMKMETNGTSKSRDAATKKC